MTVRHDAKLRCNVLVRGTPLTAPQRQDSDDERFRLNGHRSGNPSPVHELGFGKREPNQHDIENDDGIWLKLRSTASAGSSGPECLHHLVQVHAADPLAGRILAETLD